MNNLLVIMPVYNEQEAIAGVVNEWLLALRELKIGFKLCVLNDGSKDNTLSIIQNLASQNPEMVIVDKPNTGHGQTCIYGYKYALQNGAEWIFQIDSDGQCDPRFFKELVKQAATHKVVYGFRRTRDDGLARFLISRIVSLFALLSTGVWVADANVPYRLMHASTLAGKLDSIPSDFHLANILISVIQKRNFGITWVPIHFLDRKGGTPSVKPYSFAKHGFKLFRQLKDMSGRI